MGTSPCPKSGHIAGTLLQVAGGSTGGSALGASQGAWQGGTQLKLPGSLSCNAIQQVLQHASLAEALPYLSRLSTRLLESLKVLWGAAVLLLGSPKDEERSAQLNSRGCSPWVFRSLLVAIQGENGVLTPLH